MIAAFIRKEGSISSRPSERGENFQLSFGVLKRGGERRGGWVCPGLKCEGLLPAFEALH